MVVLLLHLLHRRSCCLPKSSGSGRGLSGTVAATVSREQRRGGGREQGGGGGGCCGRREVERPPDQPANRGLDIPTLPICVASITDY